MLVDLKITTIGKLISSTLVFCFVVMGLNMIEFSTATAYNGDSAKITMIPVNGIQGSNKVGVYLDTDGAEINIITVKFSEIGISGTWNYFDCAVTVSANCALNPNSPLKGVIKGNNTLTLVGGSDDSVNASDYLLFTLSLDPNSSLSSAQTFTIQESEMALSDGSEVKTVAGDSYDLIVNATPSASNFSPNTTGVDYDADITFDVSDATDNEFKLSMILCELSGGSCSSGNLLATHYDLGNQNPDSFEVVGVTGSQQLQVSLSNKKYLKYSTEYRFTVVAIDDQGKESPPATESFTTQADQTPPPKQFEAKIDKFAFGAGMDDVVVNYSFKVNPDYAPGKLSKAYVFAMQDVNSVTPGLMTNGVDGLSYSSYASWKTALNTLVSNNGTPNSQSYLSMVDIPAEATSVEGEIVARRFLRNAININQITNPFKSKLIFLVVVDEQGNYSNPSFLVKPGDVRGSGSTYQTGGFPDGVINKRRCFVFAKAF
jgi:hypothetical protein